MHEETQTPYGQTASPDTSGLRPTSPGEAAAITSFPVSRYRFEFEVTTPLRLPEYAGSALRGAFGAALRRVACLTRLPDCNGCPLTRT